MPAPMAPAPMTPTLVIRMRAPSGGDAVRGVRPRRPLQGSGLT